MRKEQKKRKRLFVLSALVLFAVLFVSAGPARAQHREHGDIRHFHERDFGRWRGGHWVHGWHYRRFGWWWVVPWGWYFYPAPVYPYPDPYVPPAAAVQPPPVVQAQPQAQTWYYCDRPAGYYPYVPECPTGWKAVPATPPPPAAPAPPATPPPPPPSRY